jgi:hypothetical protein
MTFKARLYRIATFAAAGISIALVIEDTTGKKWM